MSVWTKYNQHPNHPFIVWQREVGHSETELGYAEWVNSHDPVVIVNTSKYWVVQQGEHEVDIIRFGKPGTISISAEPDKFVVNVWDEQDTPEVQGTVEVYYEDLKREEPHYDNPIL